MSKCHFQVRGVNSRMWEVGVIVGFRDLSSALCGIKQHRNRARPLPAPSAGQPCYRDVFQLSNVCVGSRGLLPTAGVSWFCNQVESGLTMTPS